jgi:O-acetyl-ADP-ribose deacetylase (regulator of RNase III)/predicted RNA-binding Zn-ribbon protein involved in translation (DUF1610 family)
MTKVLRKPLGNSVGRRQHMVPGDFSDAQWDAAEVDHIEALRGYRLPIQVCPRGCEHRELARRDLLTRTRPWGRVDVHTVFTFETSNCPKCGAPLVRHCTRCRREILAPAADRCQFCGLPQPWAAERRAGIERSAIRRWRPNEDGVNDPADLLFENKRGEIWVLEGDITRVKVDAVVSNDDVDGQMWSEVARAIKGAAGEHVERRAQDDTPYEIGHAWLTEAGDLPLKGIIHVALMSRHGGSGTDVVRDCLIAALDVAAEERFDSIGIAAIGSGPNAIDPTEWFNTFIRTTVEYLTDAPNLPRPHVSRISIVLVLFEPENYDRTLTALADAVLDAREDPNRWAARRRRISRKWKAARAAYRAAADRA